MIFFSCFFFGWANWWRRLSYFSLQTHHDSIALALLGTGYIGCQIKLWLKVFFYHWPREQKKVESKASQNFTFTIDLLQYVVFYKHLQKLLTLRLCLTEPCQWLPILFAGGQIECIYLCIIGYIIISVDARSSKSYSVSLLLIIKVYKVACLSAAKIC